MQFRTPYDGLRVSSSDLDFAGEVSLAKQSFADECDINNIMARYRNDGLLTHVMKYQGRYDDVSLVLDYQESLNNVMRAEEAFMSLPAHVRSKFDNDPGKFLIFATNEANADEMRKLGLLKEVVVPEAAPAASAAPPATS